MKKIIIASILLCSSLFSASIQLKSGWNLVGINSNDVASSLQNNPDILRATGGGLGLGAGFTYNSNRPDNAEGNFIENQGYWILTDKDTTLTFNEVPSSVNSVTLYIGWNLIHFLSTVEASALVNYPQILRATGGGVGDGAGFTYNSNRPNNAEGTSLSYQGYWVLVDSQFDMQFNVFNYRAWGIGGSDATSKLTTRINGRTYTIFAYSTENIDSNDVALQNGNFSIFEGTLLSKSFSNIKLSGYYNTKHIVLKVFKSANTFDETTFVATSDSKVASADYIDVGNIALSNVDDFRPIAPIDSNIELPPVAPSF